MATVKEVKLMKDGAMVTPVVLTDSVKNLDGTSLKSIIPPPYTPIVSYDDNNIIIENRDTRTVRVYYKKKTGTSDNVSPTNYTGYVDITGESEDSSIARSNGNFGFISHINSFASSKRTEVFIPLIIIESYNSPTYNKTVYATLPEMAVGDTVEFKYTVTFGALSFDNYPHFGVKYSSAGTYSYSYQVDGGSTVYKGTASPSSANPPVIFNDSESGKYANQTVIFAGTITRTA